MAALDYLAKLKRGLGLAFGAHFGAKFFLNQPLKQWLTGKKTREDENTKV